MTVTREPGGTPLGDELRRLILDPAVPSATPLVMALMLSASRAQLLHDVISPALARGDVVIVDRYADSTVAYQAFGSGLPLQAVETLTSVATGGLRPDMTIYLDVSPDVGLKRLQARGDPNRLDAETLDFHRRVRAGYEYLIAHDPGRWVRIDGSLDSEQVHSQVVTAVLTKLHSSGGPE